MLVNWIVAYLELTDVIKLDQNTLLVATGVIDLVTIAGILMMGIEFFQKLKKLFVWEGLKESVEV